jgi:hypothetical protein
MKEYGIEWAGVETEYTPEVQDFIHEGLIVSRATF